MRVSARRLVLLGLALLGSCRGSAERTALEPAEAPPLSGLEVTRGGTFALSAVRGKVVLLAFGFTSCLGVCPQTLARMHTVYERLGPDAVRLQALYVSVDPERDQPEHFKRFLADFDPRIFGLFVPRDALGQVLAGFDLVADKRPAELRKYPGRTVDQKVDYSLEHTTSIWLIDRRGNLRLRYTTAATADDIAADVRTLLRGG
jgi:protein SCO1/2